MDHFDHNDHCTRLEAAARELRRLGKDNLAGAVERARSIHIQEQGRVAQARQVEGKLRRLAEAVTAEANHLGRYVGHPDGPWIGPELFPRDAG